MDRAVEGDVDLHAPSHVLRYVSLLVGAVAVGVGVYFFESYADKRDAVTMQRFDAFRAVYADKCGVPDYAGAVPELVQKQYVSSPAIQAAVDRELAALQSGAGCGEVGDILKKVDLVVPKPLQ
jgi:hypothetical protein